MDDADFIIGLMRTETDALGFIPAPDIRRRWIPTGRYVIQHNHKGGRRGYLLWGPMRPGKVLHVNQCCIQYDHRQRGFATLAVRHMLDLAATADVSAVILRCAYDLPAIHFWSHLGFHPIAFTLGGKRRNRRIVTFYRGNQPALTPLFRGFALQSPLLRGENR